MRTITKESVKGESVKIHNYPLNGAWAWKDRAGNWHLVRDGEELTAGLEAKEVYSYFNFQKCHWGWKDREGNCHLMRNNIELTKGLEVKEIGMDRSGSWGWQDRNGRWHFLMEKNRRLCADEVRTWDWKDSDNYEQWEEKR